MLTLIELVLLEVARLHPCFLAGETVRGGQNQSNNSIADKQDSQCILRKQESGGMHLRFAVVEEREDDPSSTSATCRLVFCHSPRFTTFDTAFLRPFEVPLLNGQDGGTFHVRLSEWSRISWNNSGHPGHDGHMQHQGGCDVLFNQHTRDVPHSLH